MVAMAAVVPRGEVAHSLNPALADSRGAAPPRPPDCRSRDALATARQVFESWLRAYLRPTFGRASTVTAGAVPSSIILHDVEKIHLPSTPNAESRKLFRELAARLNGLEGLVERGRGPQGAVPEAGTDVLDVGLEILSVFTKLEAERAATLAAVDPLTGLGGRRAMDERLQQEKARMGREGRRCAIALMDVDHFKRVNDTHGHAAGDKVLVRFAGLLQGNLRPYDGVYRYGGEEFVLCLPGVEATVAQRMVERIRAAFTRTSFESPSGGCFFVSFSAGIAEVKPDLATAQTLSLADAALYQAKSAGRNRVVLSDSPAAA
jgi:diguanylate cyclase